MSFSGNHTTKKKKITPGKPWFLLCASGCSVNTRLVIYHFDLTGRCVSGIRHPPKYARYTLILKIFIINSGGNILFVKCANSPFPSLRSQWRWFSLFPPADPVGRIKPARSGRSWTCEGWRAAVSRSVPEQDPLRCGHKHKPAASTTKAIKNKFIQWKCNIREICF